MDKIMNLILMIGDLALSLIVYPMAYVLNIMYLVYMAIRYDVDFKEGFDDITKKFRNYLVNGFKVYKERILGD